MSAAARLVGALPVALAGALFGVVLRDPAPAAVLGALLVAAVVLGGRWQPHPIAQHAATALAGGVGLAAGLLVHPTDPAAETLAALWCALALASLFAATFRLFLARPPWGYGGTLGLVLVAVVVCGETRVGPAYPALAVAALAAGLAALRASDPARAPWRALARRDRVAGAALLAATAAMGTAGALALPRLHDRVFQAVMRSWSAQPTSGFSDELTLDALEGMFQSDDVVLRLHGPSVDYLRGAVFDHYEHGRWYHLPDPAARWVRTETGEAPPGAVRVMRVGAGPNRHFLPLRAQRLGTRSGRARVDGFGTVLPVNESGDTVWFVPGPRSARPLADAALATPPVLPAVAPPTDADLVVPPIVRARLEPLVAAWTADVPPASPAQTVAALTRRLALDYRYALRAPRDRRHDPVLDFLYVHRAGHCEYFASALALLCRSAGVPARVVTGYRVAERNPLGGYHVVRERNAHAWVEVWIPRRGWLAADATPAAEIPSNLPHTTAAWRVVGDLIAARWDAAAAWLARRGPGELLAGTGGAAALVLAVFWLRELWGRRARRWDPAEADGEAPLPCLDALVDALDRHGVARPPAEPLERFACRVAGASHLGTDGPAAAALVARYAALRYGAVGDAAALDREMTALAARLTAKVG